MEQGESPRLASTPVPGARGEGRQTLGSSRVILLAAALAGGRSPGGRGGGKALTRHRSFKKVVRDRMRRAGVSYTAALAQVRRTPPP